MDARDRLRQYLEQRRDMGEEDLVLDGLSVDEVMRLLGAKGTSPMDRGSGPMPAVRVPPEERAAPAPEPRPAPPTTPKVPRNAFPIPAAPGAPGAATAPAGTAGPIVVGGSLQDAAGVSAGSYATLDEVAAAVAACTRCALHSTAKNPVPGDGNPNARFVCVGEAPGATEDETGKPFVGAAGQLLTKILEAIQFKREDVFICNVLKHRPPGNRNPAPDEIVACSPYLMRQLALLQPRVILALGSFAAQTLLQTTTPIGKLRGQIHRFYGVPLIVTYHPAALLRNPNWKRPTWEDVQLARRIFDDAGPA